MVTRGPKPDICEFEKTLTHAIGRQRIVTLLGDAGYESEGAHQWCREDLHIQSIFPTTDRGRRRHDGKANNLTGYYRRQLRKNFPRETYGQRWQIETDFSMLKRLLGSAVRSRRRYAIDREILLRVMTINLMIILCLIICFQQSISVPYFPPFPFPGTNSPASQGVVQRTRPVFAASAATSWQSSFA